MSDVLLQHHAVVTRKWLSGIIQELKSKNSTVVAVINPQMHSQEEVKAILSLFDGEISLSEKQGRNESKKVLKVVRLHDQGYLKDELTMN